MIIDYQNKSIVFAEQEKEVVIECVGYFIEHQGVWRQVPTKQYNAQALYRILDVNDEDSTSTL